MALEVYELIYHFCHPSSSGKGGIGKMEWIQRKWVLMSQQVVRGEFDEINDILKWDEFKSAYYSMIFNISIFISTSLNITLMPHVLHVRL